MVGWVIYRFSSLLKRLENWFEERAPALAGVLQDSGQVVLAFLVLNVIYNSLACIQHHSRF